MNKVKVNFKLRDDGKPPKQGLEGDFGTDLYLREDVILLPTAIEATLAGAGISTEFDPDKYGMLLTLRSSMSKLPISMANHVGVIEGTYRGEIMVPLRNILNTRNVGETEAVDYVLVWDEPTKKLIERPSSEVPTRLHQRINTQLMDEFGLVGGEVGHLAYSMAQKMLPKGTIIIEKGTRVAQAYMVNKHVIDWVEKDELSTSERGTGGFGSTNNKEE